MRVFDPETVTRKEMKVVADNLRCYMHLLKERMIIPDEVKPSEEKINKAIKKYKELMKKLEKGNTNIFNDDLD